MGVYKDIELIGQATGTTDAATSLTADMRGEIDAISGAVSGQSPKPRVFYDVGYDAATGAIFAPADQSFVAEMVTLAGADTITTGDPNTYADPARDAHRRRTREVIVLGVNPFYSPTPDAGRDAPRLERHDRGEERRHQAGQRHRDHPARAASADRPAQPGRRRSGRT